jgi:predicted secreted protein
MAARSGRELLVKKAGVAIAGLRTTSVSFTAGGVDITDKMDDGFRTMAEFSGTQSFDISASGVAKDATIRDLFKSGGGYLLTDVTLEWDSGEEWECDIWVESYSEAGEHGGEVTFDVTMQSSGAWSEVP